MEPPISNSPISPNSGLPPVDLEAQKKDALQIARSGAAKAVKTLGKLVTREIVGLGMLGMASLAFLAGAGMGIVGQVAGAITAKSTDGKVKNFKEGCDDLAISAFKVSASSAVQGVFHVGKGLATPVIDIIKQPDATNDNLREWFKKDLEKGKNFQIKINLGELLPGVNVKSLYLDENLLGDPYVERIYKDVYIEDNKDLINNYTINMAKKEVLELGNQEACKINSKHTLGCAIGILYKKKIGQDLFKKEIYLQQANLYEEAAKSFRAEGKSQEANAADSMARSFREFADHPENSARLSDLQKIEVAQQAAGSHMGTQKSDFGN